MKARNPGYLVALLLLACAMPLYGQFSSNLLGTVGDPTGAVIPGAAVTITNVSTQVSMATTTDSGGNYAFHSLAPGEWHVSAQASGFTTVALTVTLETSQTLNLPIKLQLATQTQTVQVSTRGPLLDTADSRLQETLGAQEMATLPLAGRSVFNLISMAPGVTGLGLITGGSPGSAPDNYAPEIQVNASANGRSFQGNAYAVDGLDITSGVRPGVINMSPNPDSVQEISIQTNTFTADQARASSVLTTITTKSGTDHYHGSISDYYTSQQLWARTEFTSNYLPFHIDNASATVGGPIIKNHTFFFASIEPLFSNVSTSGAYTFEAPQFVQWAQQNFPGTLGTKVLTQYSPAGVTTTGVSKTAQSVFPGTCGTSTTANIPCALPLIDSGSFQASPPRNGLQWNTRIDQYWRKDRLYGNYYQTLLNTGSDAPRFSMDTTNHYSSKSLQLNETHTFSPSMLNEAMFGYLRIQGLTDQSGPFHIPLITIVGQTDGIGVGTGEDYIQHNFHGRDVVTLTRGTHSVEIGGDVFEGDEISLFAPQYAQPSFVFENLLNFVQDQPQSETGYAYDPLTGERANANFGRASTGWGAFAQDEWKAKHNLTVTLGFRFDDFGNAHPSSSLHSVFSQFFLGAGTTFQQQVGNGSLRQVPNSLNSSLLAPSPRLGVAWDPTGKGVWTFRAGIGVFHDWVTTAEQTDRLRTNPPLFALPTFLTGTTTPPLFVLGSSDTFPYGYTNPPTPPTTLDDHGGVTGRQLSIGGIDPNTRSPDTYNYMIGVERQLGRDWVAGGTFSGSRSTGLWIGSETSQTSTTDVNRFAGDLIINDNVLDRLNPSFGAINYGWGGNTSTYRALILTLMGRLGQRSTIQASYTHSSAYDYGTNYPSQTDIAQYWGPSDFNVPDRFSLSESYQLPGLGHANAFTRRLLGGWRLAGTVILESGMPFSVYTSAPFEPTLGAQGNVVGLRPGSGDYNADGYDYDFPNLPASGCNHGTTRDDYLGGLFSASAFGVPQLGTEGNAPRDCFQGPSFAEWDAGVLKRVRLSERASLELRFEFYNILNHPNLGQVNSNLSSASFGRSTGTFDPRYLQIGAKIEF